MKKSDVDAPRPEHSPSPSPREHSIERLLSLLENIVDCCALVERAVERNVAIVGSGADGYKLALGALGNAIGQAARELQ